MPRVTSLPFDLRARAYRAVRDAGFVPDLDTDAMNQRSLIILQETEPRFLARPSPDPRLAEAADLRGLLWSSIDNDESRDLDQIEVAEQMPDGEVRVRVGIADVDALVPAGSPLDLHASANTTSIYTGIKTFPMLPEALSTDLTSLHTDVDRLAMVIEMIVTADGTVRQSKVGRALVRNRAKLSYEQIGPWLDGHEPTPDAVVRLDGLEAQLRLQHTVAQRLHKQRYRRGALDFDMVEAQPVFQQGRVTALTVPRKNPARYLIEDFMIAANSAMAELLAASGSPSIQRVVRSPQRWPRIVEIAARYSEVLPLEPDARALADFLERRHAADALHFPDLSLSIVKLLGPGEYAVVHGPDVTAVHFGLAVTSYTHSTAPNRRFADLVIQRLLKAYLRHGPAPYPVEELERIALHCTERETAARKVERLMRKVAAAVMLSDRIGQTFDAIVTGASPKGTYVRVISPPVEGRVVAGEQGLDVGDQTHVRLISVNPELGFIDFARA